MRFRIFLAVICVNSLIACGLLEPGSNTKVVRRTKASSQDQTPVEPVDEQAPSTEDDNPVVGGGKIALEDIPTSTLGWSGVENLGGKTLYVLPVE